MKNLRTRSLKWSISVKCANRYMAYLVFTLLCTAVPAQRIHQACKVGCPSINDIRRLSSEQLQARGLDELLQEDDSNPVFIDGVERNRLAYTLEEWLESFDGENATANTECIQGHYSRYVLGTKTGSGGNPEYFALISHPYNAEQTAYRDPSTGHMLDKAVHFDQLMMELCYTVADRGWVSLADWHLIDPSVGGGEPSLRFTTHNYTNAPSFGGSEGDLSSGDWSARGRITPGSEYFEVLSSTADWLFEIETTTLQGYALSNDISGPNFPATGYSYDPLRTLSPLVRMSQEKWLEDVSDTESPNLRYYTDVYERDQFLLSQDETTGLIYKRNGELISQVPENFSKSIYVMDCMGRMYWTDLVLNPGSSFARSKHSQFLGGGSVAAAGVLYIVNGIPQYVSNSSGHYLPDVSTLTNPREWLSQAFEEPFPNHIHPFHNSWICSNRLLGPAPLDGSSIATS